LACS
jgi:hypothetical protein